MPGDTLEQFAREMDGSWRYRVVGAGGRLDLTNGVILVVDEIFEAAFDLPQPFVEARKEKRTLAFMRRFAAFGFVLLGLSGCTTRVTDFTVISTKNTALTVGHRKGNRVTGESCAVVVLFPFGIPSVKQAIDNAIENAGNPEYDALVDGVVYYKNHSFLFGEICYEVQGTAVVGAAARAEGSPEIWPRSVAAAH